MSKTHKSRGLYRSRNGVLLGVCRGLAEHYDFKVFWIRSLVVVLLLLTGIWPMLGIYLVAALIMRPEPVRPFENDAEREFYDSYVRSRPNATDRLRRRFQNLERRIRRMETVVTSREYEWDRRMKP